MGNMTVHDRNQYERANLQRRAAGQRSRARG